MSDARFTPLGKLITIAMIAGLITLGVWLIQKPDPSPDEEKKESEQSEAAAEVAEVKVEVPRLSPPAPYQPKNNTLDLEISEYAGYTGLIVANGGLEPSENSLFFKNHGFKVRLTISEDENWSELNEGKIGASVTTVDVVAAYGRQFHVIVPAQIGFSRGADGLAVRKEITKINDLKGKIIATAQFTEVDFFIRYLAQEAGLAIATLGSLDSAPDPEKVNLVFTDEGEKAGALFADDMRSGRNRLAGCVTWEPTLSEVVEGSGGKAHILTTNRNLLIIADILVVNRGFSEQNPKMVAGLVHGLLEGNRLVRDTPDQHLDTIGRAFKWSREDTRQELAKVHLSNLPETLAFFSGAIDAAGSFGGIFQSAVYAYGKDVIKDPADSERFANLTFLKALEAAGTYKDQKVAIAPIGSRSAASIEADPLLSKDIRFLFEANSADLDLSNQDNISNLDAIKRLLQVSPGSTIVLRGHVDNARVDEFRRDGGEALVRKMAMRAMELSRKRAAEIKSVLVEKHNVDGGRLETVGRGWEEPAGADSDRNRRVEVQWFTIE